MLNAKTVHFILLGVILGSAAAYVYSMVQITSRRQAEAEALMSAELPSGDAHADMTNQEMMALFEQALAVSPNDPELTSRYAGFLFDLGRYPEAVEWFRRTLELTPEDATIRTGLATALYGMGQVNEAVDEYERALDIDPDNILALHNLMLAYLEPPRDIEAAEEALARIEALDPDYPSLGTLRERLERARSLG